MHFLPTTFLKIAAQEDETGKKMSIYFKKGWNLVTPAGDYAVAMAIKIAMPIKILERDEWTAPEGFNII